MKIVELAEKYSLVADELESFILSRPEIKASGVFNVSIRDEEAEKIVEMYKASLEENDPAVIALNKELSKILVTPGFNFDGYTIREYSEFISKDCSDEIHRSGVIPGGNSQPVTDSLEKLRTKALRKLKEAAHNLGSNAIIGVRYDYITLSPETRSIAGGMIYEPYVICVTASGTAVSIEKNS